MIEFVFELTGMSCAACTNSIERLMHSNFDEKGMQSVAVVLLTHKMVATFPLRVFRDKAVTPKLICDTFESTKFTCELLGMTEISNESRYSVGGSQSGVIDADGTHDADDQLEESIISRDVSSPSRGLISSVPVTKQTAVQIKTAAIQVEEATGPLSPLEVKTIIDAVEVMDGVVDCQVQTNVLPNQIHISYRINGTPLRHMVDRIRDLGFRSAVYKPKEEQNSIRATLDK